MLRPFSPVQTIDRHVRGQRVGLELDEHLPAVERARQVDVEADHGGRARERPLEPGLARRRELDLEAVERQALAQQRREHRVVLDHEHAGAVVGRARTPGARQLEPERAADALAALEADAPAVRGDDLVAEREPEARAADLARVRGVDAEEAREDLRLLARGDAEAGVGHLDAREALARRRRDRHGAARG